MDYTPNPNAQEPVRPFFTPAMVVQLQSAFSQLNALGITPQINSGFRTPEDQKNINSGANPKAGLGHSWHQAGMAIDINASYPAIGRIMVANGFVWGAGFQPVDRPHFQTGRGSISAAAIEDATLYFKYCINGAK